MYGSGVLVEESTFALQSFIGLGLATRLFSHAYKFENEKFRVHWRVHRKIQNEWEYFTRFELDDSTSDVLRHLTVFAFADSYEEARRIPWLRTALSRIDKVFSSESSATIVLAAKWFFDSYRRGDPTLKYIRLMTTLEILLGEHADRSKASLGEILGNRLAYLIGKNQKERQEILQTFKKIYGLRSSILHHGKHKLTSRDWELLSALQKYCQRAIEGEVAALLA